VRHTANPYALQRTRRERRVCNPRVTCAGSLSAGACRRKEEPKRRRQALRMSLAFVRSGAMFPRPTRPGHAFRAIGAAAARRLIRTVSRCTAPMKRYIEFTAGAAEAIEFVIFVSMAAVLVAVGPLIWFYRLLTSHHAALATVVAICWFGSVFVVAREVRNKAITAFSFGVFLAWLVVLAYVFHDSLL